MSDIKQQYLRAKQILAIANNADDHSMEAICIKAVWTPEDLYNLDNLVKSWEDQGIQYTIKKVD